MKIFLLTTVAGAGHNQAARALQKAFELEAPSHQVAYLDASELGTKLVRKMYNDSYLKLVETTPTLWGYVYERCDQRKLSRTKEKLKSLFSRLNSRPLMRTLEEERPDVLVATHFYPAEIALRLKRKGRISSRLEVVITDFQPHLFWVLEGVDHYYVADEETRVALSARGVDLARISVTGIPVDPKFSVRRDRRELRTRLGLDPDRFTAVVSSGGMGMGPMEDVVRTLVEERLVPQILVICGKNEKLKASLDKMVVPEGLRLSVHGFVQNMEEFMGAADVLISKCGGLTTAESLAVGLPMIILHPIPGQEAQNSDLLLERGVAIKANDLHSLKWKVQQLVARPDRLDEMRSRIANMAKPEAARQIALAVVAHSTSQSLHPDAPPRGSVV